MIDNILLLLRGSIHGKPVGDLLAKCHPLGQFEAMAAVAACESPEELYTQILIDSSLCRASLVLCEQGRVIPCRSARYCLLHYNAVYQKLFGYSYRESVTILQHSLKRFTWEELVEDRKGSFIERCRHCSIHSLVGTCVRINH